MITPRGDIPKTGKTMDASTNEHVLEMFRLHSRDGLINLYVTNINDSTQKHLNENVISRGMVTKHKGRNNGRTNNGTRGFQLRIEQVRGCINRVWTWFVCF